MKSNAILVGGLFFAFSACASTNNGGHVVGNPIISESASSKMKEPTCDCASSKDPKVKAACKCAVDSKSTATCKDGDKTCSK